jgi:hypothetical protein
MGRDAAGFQVDQSPGGKLTIVESVTLIDRISSAIYDIMQLEEAHVNAQRKLRVSAPVI